MNITVFWDVAPCSSVDLPATLQSSTSQMTGKKVRARVSLPIKKIIQKENMHAQHNKHNCSASTYKGHIVYHTHTHTHTHIHTHTQPYRLLPENNQQHMTFGQTCNSCKTFLGVQNRDLHGTGYTGSCMHKHKGSHPQVTLNTVYMWHLLINFSWYTKLSFTQH